MQVSEGTNAGGRTTLEAVRHAGDEQFAQRREEGGSGAAEVAVGRKEEGPSPAAMTTCPTLLP